MKINVAMLRRAVDTALARADQAQVDYDEALKEAEKQHFESFKHSLQAWRPFYEALGKALRKNATQADVKAVKGELMPQGIDRYGDPRTARLWKPFRDGAEIKDHSAWDAQKRVDHTLGSRPVYEVRNLENLRDFLAMIEDEVVASADLDKAGFRNISKLMDTVRDGHWTKP